MHHYLSAADAGFISIARGSVKLLSGLCMRVVAMNMSVFTNSRQNESADNGAGVLLFSRWCDSFHSRLCTTKERTNIFTRISARQTIFYCISKAIYRQSHFNCYVVINHTHIFDFDHWLLILSHLNLKIPSSLTIQGIPSAANVFEVKTASNVFSLFA